MSDLVELETGWRRLNRRMLLIHPVQEGIRFLPALAGVFILGRTRDEANHWWELAALVAVVGLGVMRYFTTRFRIHHGQIELRKGLVNKQVVATPADRVRTVDLTSPLFHRILGLAKVEIGTAGHDRLVLDALTVAEARLLREELIHSRSVLVPGPTPDGPTSPGDRTLPLHADGPAGSPAPGDAPWGAAATATAGAAAPAYSRSDETTLLVLDPTWIRYAPLTMTGLVSALAILGFANQFLQRAFEESRLTDTFGRLGENPWWLDLLAGLVALVVFVSVLAVIGYALQFWGFRLTRHRAGTLHVTRGLITTRETSIEEKRLRGVEVGEPLGLRLAGGGRLHAITTGLSQKEQDRGSAWLVPPAPARVVARVAAAIVGDGPALTAPLVEHGPPARRRRLTRAVVPALVIALAALVLGLRLEWPVWAFVLGFLPAVAAPALAKDRYAGLGHLLTPTHLVVRSGSFSRRRDVLLRSGIIGWTLRQSFFQRRAGIASLVATTAAGKQAYTAYDVPWDVAVGLAREVDPALLDQFLA